jgi:hypothetical protein
MARAGEAALIFGTTDQSWGYLTNMTDAETTEMIEASNGAGDIKAAEFFGKKRNVTGTYIYRSETSSPELQIGTGTTVTVTDTELGGAVYIQNVTRNKSQGEFYTLDFEGWIWPSLGT